MGKIPEFNPVFRRHFNEAMPHKDGIRPLLQVIREWTPLPIISSERHAGIKSFL